MDQSQDAEKLLKRTFASGYMLGKRHGYTQAVDESYPELKEGQTEVGQAIGDAISDYLNLPPTDPNGDFA